jgi:HlyD family secretion protein
MSSRNLRKAFLYLLLTFVIGGAVSYALWPKAINVDTAPVTRGLLQVTIDEDGEIRAHDRYVMAAPITGRLLRVTLRDGDHVKANQVVAVLAPLPMAPGELSQQRARVQVAEAISREAEARVAHARADADQAHRDAERSRTLASAGAMSRQESEQLSSTDVSSASDYAAARSRAASAEADVRVARANLNALESGQPVEVRAPVDALVLRISEQSERIVSAGATVMVLADPSYYELVMDVLSTDAVNVRPGMRTLIQNWGGTGTIEAKVRTVEPGAFTKISALGVEEQRVNIIADLSTRPESLTDGYRVEGRIVIWERADTLKLPVSALFRTEGKWTVFAIEDGRARLRQVEIGPRNAEEAELLNGLSDQAVVVLYPPSTLVDKARVEVSGAKHGVADR